MVSAWRTAGEGLLPLAWTASQAVHQPLTMVLRRPRSAALRPGASIACSKAARRVLRSAQEGVGWVGSAMLLCGVEQQRLEQWHLVEGLGGQGWQGWRI